ncbi:hypothetical protein B6U99_06905 [Candidatus Geothermarchaeota archaeon ex4572_27]|nr:MAG: hypothetical protein B6U99_06905 [Candidatus Geothermarchaeota archaeon ex4572_27]
MWGVRPTVTRAVEAGASPIIVSNAIAAKKLGLVRGGGRVLLEEALQHVNRAVGSLITALLEGLSSIDVVMGLDKADLRRLLYPEDPQLRGVGGLAAFRCDDVAPLKGGDIISMLYRNMYVQFKRPSNPTAMRAVLIFDLHPKDSPTVEAMDEALLRLIDDFNIDVDYVKPLVVHRRRQGSSVIAILTGARPGRDLMILEPAEYWSTRIVGWLRRKVEAKRLKERIRQAFKYGREAGVEAESPFAEE